MRHETPLDPDLVDELMELWLPIFVEGIDLTREALLGEEMPDARITVYTRRIGDRLAGACLVASSDRMPSLGGLGEVATGPDARRTGIATALTQQALHDFSERGGQALFLGTVNPAAARIYYRLGWRKLAGARLMLHVANGDSPEEFLVDYFRETRGEVVSVRAPSPSDRAPMIPLLASPHDWQVLDFNVGVMSTRHAVLDSCLGLVPAIRCDCGRRARCVWFCARTRAGHVVGLSTARLDGRWRMPRRWVHAQEPHHNLARLDSGGNRLERRQERLPHLRGRIRRGRGEARAVRVVGFFTRD